MGGFGGGFGMGGSDAKLQYIDDNPSSYSTIFGSAKTDVNDADKARLIASLKSLSSFENLEEVLDIDAVLSYFVVHIFVDNGDSYTGSMIHNYYLYEEDGQLSLADVEKVWMECYEHGVMPSATGVAWAKKSEMIKLPALGF